MIFFIVWLSLAAFACVMIITDFRRSVSINLGLLLGLIFVSLMLAPVVFLAGILVHLIHWWGDFELSQKLDRILEKEIIKVKV